MIPFDSWLHALYIPPLCFDCFLYVCLIHRNSIRFLVMVQRNVRSGAKCKADRQEDRIIEENSEGRREEKDQEVTLGRTGRD